MKIIPALLLVIVLMAFTDGKKLLTEKYGGSYSYGTDIEKERIGSIDIYPETDSSVLFYLDLNRGAPSYNMGAEYGRLVVKNDSAIYLAQSSDACKLLFTFLGKSIVIKSINNSGCGYGGGVYADGSFYKDSDLVKSSFINHQGDTIYFASFKH